MVASVPFWLEEPKKEPIEEVVEKPKIEKPQSLVKPDIPDFTTFVNVRKKKQAFMHYLQPVF